MDYRTLANNLELRSRYEHRNHTFMTSTVPWAAATAADINRMGYSAVTGNYYARLLSCGCALFLFADGDGTAESLPVVPDNVTHMT